MDEEGLPVAAGATASATCYLSEEVMMATNKPNAPGGFPPQWLKYWGPGGAGGDLISWNTPGDFMRCVKAIGAKVEEHGHHLPDAELKGLCNHLHQRFTGATPGHAPGEQTGKHH